MRPNGASGPLAASLGMVEDYLIVQGREWERYAWVKARAGHRPRGRHRGPGRHRAARSCSAATSTFGVIDAIRIDARPDPRRSRRARKAPHPSAATTSSSGRGGIREIEFLAQVFQPDPRRA